MFEKQKISDQSGLKSERSTKTYIPGSRPQGFKKKINLKRKSFFEQTLLNAEVNEVKIAGIRINCWNECVGYHPQLMLWPLAVSETKIKT